MPDAILIEQLEVSAHVGVPDAERGKAQRLAVNLRIEPRRDFRALGDELENTVDYFAVCQAVQALAAARPRRLIETLGEEIAALILEDFAAAAVEVEVRKFILPDTAFVAIRIRRERDREV
ncbi:MAG: 7,8-dihydroneopterin aldolase/epimerase/oxygenase [Chthoniobacter sp.]|jgi:dihydroneopterin aldolase|nr:7,8-dihydroneopterin aldolase/epimerase/oxygenase [Chthoniobacter sp.]